MRMSLVIMAAGLGSRYGGNKQVDGIGPNGEMLMEYAIYDALRAGFGRVVFIIKPEMEALMERLCVRALRDQRTAAGEMVEVCYAFQDFTSLPTFYTPPADRVKPYGTVHALLCAREAVDGPFCVINADDYYGVGAYQTLYEALKQLPERGRGAMVGYHLKNTASLYGTVCRGVCQTEGARLRSIQEITQIQLYEDGTLRDLTGDRELPADTVVSMNFWGFTPAIFDRAQHYFEEFLRSSAGTELKSECLLPVMVGDLLSGGELEVEVLSSADRWFGMTYRQDRERVAEELRQLHRSGVYPQRLWQTP